MTFRDTKDFLKFMSGHNLSIASILNLFFKDDDEGEDSAPAGNPKPDDIIASSDVSSTRTAEHHTLSYLKARTSEWIGRTGNRIFLQALDKRWNVVLPIIIKQLEKDAKQAVNESYLRGPSTTNTTIVSLQDFDHEVSSKLLRSRFPCTNAVMSAVCGSIEERDDGDASADEPQNEGDEELDLDASFNPTGQATRKTRGDSSNIMRRFGRRRKAAVVSTALHMLLFARNQQCNRWPMQVALDLLGARVPRRSVELLSRLGVVGSYASADRIFKSMAEDDKRNSRALLSNPATTFSISYDNVNWMQGVRDPRLEKSSQIMAAVAGTAYIHDKQAQYDPGQPICSNDLYKRTLGPNVPRPTALDPMAMSPTTDGVADGLRRAPQDDLQNHARAQELHPELYLPGRPEEQHMSEVVLSHALRSWVAHHSTSIKASEVPAPPQVLPMLPAKTRLLGLPVLNLDEGTVAGNIEVVKTYMEFLGIRNELFCKEKIVPIVADAFTIAHLRSAMARRALDRSLEPNFDRLQFLQPWSALFHLQYAFIKAFLDAHGGTVTHQSAVSARILWALLWASGNADFYRVDIFIKTFFAGAIEAILTPALRRHLEVQDDITDVDAFAELDLETLRSVCRSSLSPILNGSSETVALAHGDLEHADLLYLHGRTALMDAAIFIELRDSVKVGDLGRTLIATKCALPLFAATGHTRYTQEVNEIHHQIQTELPPALVTTMLSASVVNHAGRKDSWLPANLDIEHQVKELKKSFRVTASADVVRNGHIGQIISALRQMRMRWYQASGISSIGGDHTSRSIARGFATLARHFRASSVFEWVPGRSCKSFELFHGEDVQRRKEAGDRNARQAKGVTTDSNEYGICKLTAFMQDWMARRKRDRKGTDPILPPQATDADEHDEELDLFAALTDAEIEELVTGFNVLPSDD
ncbi:hypothetical protein V8E36_003870 [Tilletia maclaganii]